MAAFLIANHALTEGEVALPLALVSLGLVVGSLMGGEVSRNRWGLPIVAVTFTLAGVAGMFVFDSAWSTWVSVGMGFAVGALTSLAMPTFLNIVAWVGGAPDLRYGSLRGDKSVGFFARGSAGRSDTGEGGLRPAGVSLAEYGLGWSGDLPGPVAASAP